jgi:hypothetical protein
VDDFHRSFLLLTCPVSLIFQLFWRLQGLLQRSTLPFRCPEKDHCSRRKGHDEHGAGKCVNRGRGTGIHGTKHVEQKRILATDQVVGPSVFVQRKEKCKDEAGEGS